jgi:hypothetical protein
MSLETTPNLYAASRTDIESAMTLIATLAQGNFSSVKNLRYRYLAN